MRTTSYIPSPITIDLMVNWSHACTTQLNRPMWQLQQANYGGGLFAVSAFVTLMRLLVL